MLFYFYMLFKKSSVLQCNPKCHYDVIKWKHFPRYWPFVRGIHRSPVWRGTLMISLICACLDGWVNNREAGDLRRYRNHYDVPVMVMNAMYCGNIVWYFKMDHINSKQVTETWPNCSGHRRHKLVSAMKSCTIIFSTNVKFYHNWLPLDTSSLIHIIPMDLAIISFISPV